MKQLFIFDYDGVIADSLDTWIDVLGRIGSKHMHNYRLTKENVNQLEHITMDGILKMSGRKREESGEYLAEVYSEMEKKALEVPFFEGIDRILIKAGTGENTVCVNTANSSKVVRSRLKSADLEKYVKDITGGDTPGSKSEKIRYFMDKYRFTSDNTWMIGDSRGDIIEGKKAGVMTVAVTYGWHSYERMEDTMPDYIFRTIAELENFISEKGSLQ